ncbi:MAG: hypothetical protein COT24_00540 [Candidatus Kerfeldbacteria bacterium CG08_land_8_20_14_0_20_40_16]|uniref:M23ase beta-sheet core domain-containing protein n=1 Tax=Candidatus Kerfeldbacteria bacterium CG08_land_8_20_14_0_20_40_16 TaxID=2014244 RepID=A0A2H0YZ54_9BACT|nr:MAG: hypothetical protein COT24_00540 [Candidatus Kerfeldbacteria bacterium CG08_land_8_20_14_0_20_40_16]
MDQQKSFIRKFWWLFLVLVLVIIFLGYNGWQSWQFAKSKDAKFITASPIDLSQYRVISKLRSCAGHDYSGINIDGETETNRSMKHYAVPLQKFEGTKDQVKLFAPFDGKIAKIGDTKTGSLGEGIYLTSGNGWFFEIGHIVLVPNLKAGDKVSSGQLIGYFEAQNGWALDLQFYHSGKYIDMFQGIDSYINHLAPEVEAEYAKHGLQKEAIIISKEARDQNPCQGFDEHPEQDSVNVIN